MAGLRDPLSENGKILLIGDQGEGKTGCKAALVALGYKLRMVDTDRGFKILRSLLTNTNYPYAEYMKHHGVDPEKLISYHPIEVPFDFLSQTVRGVSWDVLGPKSSAAWTQVVRLLKEWKDGDQNFGPIEDWENDTVLDFDTMSTLAEVAKYWVQDLNGHLGSLIDEHGRDTGGAQEMITRLVTKVTSPAVKCNVIMTGHIKRVDMSNDVPQSVEARLRDKKSIEVKGFPQIIGQATSPYIGKKFNDVFVVKDEGRSGRRIYTVTNDNVNAKNSVWLEPFYSVETGLAEIFCALQYRDPPTDLINHVKKFRGDSGSAVASLNDPVPRASGSAFSRRT